MSSSDIKITIDLDDDKVPSRISWLATDQDMEPTEAKAFLLALFDKDHKETLKIDLWTKEMEVIEMDRFFYHTLRAMADTYMRATGNGKLAGAMQQFANYFGEEVEAIPKGGND